VNLRSPFSRALDAPDFSETRKGSGSSSRLTLSALHKVSF
jgi:hypothetical protein